MPGVNYCPGEIAWKQFQVSIAAGGYINVVPANANRVILKGMAFVPYDTTAATVQQAISIVVVDGSALTEIELINTWKPTFTLDYKEIGTLIFKQIQVIRQQAFVGTVNFVEGIITGKAPDA
jgi:hypothetical protein